MCGNGCGNAPVRSPYSTAQHRSPPMKVGVHCQSGDVNGPRLSSGTSKTTTTALSGGMCVTPSALQAAFRGERYLQRANTAPAAQPRPSYGSWLRTKTQLGASDHERASTQ